MSVSDTAFDARNKPLGWSGKQGGAGAAVCHGGHIQYAVPDENSMLTLLTSDLSVYQSTRQFSDLNTWTPTAVASSYPASMNTTFKVTKFISVVALGDYNYVFWLNPANEYMVLRTRPDMLEAPALSRIDFGSAANGVSMKSNAAAFALPDATASIADRIGCVVMAETTGNSKVAQLMPFVLEPTAFTANGTWVATSLASGHYTNLVGLMGSTSSALSLVEHYTDISAAWINQGTVATNTSATPLPSFTLVVNCHAESGASPSCISFGLDLLRCFDCGYNLQYFKTSTVPDPVRITNIDNASSSGGATLCSAPDGSLATYYIDDDSAVVRIAKLVPNTSSSSNANYGKPGLYSPQWQHQSKDPDGASCSIAAHNTPCAVFIPMTATVGPSPCTLKPAKGSGSARTYQNCTTQKFIQCIFGSDSGNKPEMSTFYWGSLFSVPDYYVADATADYKQTMLLSMVADTFPYPVPLTSVWGADSPSGMVNWLLCSYEYLVGNSTEVDLNYDLTASVGFKAETTDTFVVGLKTESSLSTGFSLLTSNSSATLKATSLSVTSKGLPSNTSVGDDAMLTIAPEGQIFGTTPPASIGVDLCAVLPRGQTQASGPMVRTIHPILDPSIVGVAGDFQTFCYTPGNLSTYDPATIDRTMSSLFGALSADARKDFIINGEDMSGLYSGSYTSNVVQRFGSPSFGPNGNLPYLEFSFSETGIQRSEFQSTSSFTIGGGAFVDGSFYAGLAWEEVDSVEVGLFGLVDLEFEGVDSEGYLMAGAEFSTSLTASSTSTSDWGIKLGEYLNPLAPGEAYTVRMYLLQPSALWAAELKHFGFPGAKYPQTPKIDLVNSVPLRVLFTVPYVSDALGGRM